jgi:hypothetical protein|tara:strand:- start:2951 stop:4159 length:1209 start_codon:yes stop_codon:yes gene_type:complete
MAELKFRVMNDEGDFVDPQKKENVADGKEEAAKAEAKDKAEVQAEVQTEVQEQVQEQVQEEDKNKIEENGIQKEQGEAETKAEAETKILEKPAPEELDESRILQHLKERYNAQFESIDEVINKNKTEEVQLPEAVEKYMAYNKETGRGLEDFMRAQKSFDDVDESTLLSEYYKETKPYLEAKDVSKYIDQNFGVDEDTEDAEKSKRELLYKEELYNARKHFNAMKEKYSAPLESSNATIPDEYKKAYDAYNNYIEESEKTNKLTAERQNVFSDKTERLFSDNFEGFEYNVGEKKVVFKPKDVQSVKKTQSNLNNYIDKFLDKDGYLDDAAGFHRSLNMALNPDSVAKFFYEQGVADATEGLVKQTKNIDMSVRDNKTVEDKGGFKYRILDNSDSVDFKIRKR